MMRITPIDKSKAAATPDPMAIIVAVLKLVVRLLSIMG